MLVTFDYELSLISITHDENSIGDVIKKTEKRPVLCDVKSVTRGEHYQAAAHGLRPEIVFVINIFEYQGEKEVEFEGKRYRVLRAYAPKQARDIGDFETIELICQGVVNNANA